MSADWKKLYETHGDSLVLYARQFTQCRADAEDIVQNAFVRLFGSRTSSLPTHENPRALLFQAVRWAALDDARKKKRRKRRETESAARESDSHYFQSITPSGEVSEEFACLVSRALDQVPRDQREVLVLHIWSGFTFAEIGGQLGISPNTAASRYRYGLERLRGLAGDLRDYIEESVSYLTTD